MNKYDTYPETYRQEIVNKLIAIFEKDINVTIAGVKGSSKSRVINYIIAKKPIKGKKLIYIDLAGIFELNYITIGQSIISKINEIDKKFEIQKDSLKKDPDILIKVIENYLLSKNPPEKLLIIFDNFDILLKQNDKKSFKYIRYIYESLHDYLNFAFVIDDLKLLKEMRNGNPEELNPLQKQLIFLFGLMTENDLKPENLRTKIDINIKELFKKTGGYPGYLKFYENNEQNLMDVIAISDEIWESLDTNQQEILINIFNKEQLEKNITVEELIKLGLITEENSKLKIFSEHFEEFLQNMAESKTQEKNKKEFELQLTKMESKIFKLLHEHTENLVDKEIIAKELWGEKYTEKYSNWSIDQIIKRLRNKIKNSKLNVNIETIKGRGYILHSAET